MNQVEKLDTAVRLLKEVNCPKQILDAIFVYRMFVHKEQTKSKNWNALSQGGIINGEAKEV